MENLETKLKQRIDENGYFVEDVFTSEVSDTLIEVQPQGGFFKPKWNGSEWVEGDEVARQTSQIETLRISFNNAIQEHLDNKAQEYRYDNMMSARSYAGYDNAFQEEAIKLAKWASSCWVVAGQIENEVANGANMPTIEDVISRLPIYE